jgi:uncharacterized protein DUF3574
MTMLPARILTILSLALTACSTVPGHQCAVHEEPLVVDTLVLGSQIPGAVGSSEPNGVVSADEWAEFVNAVITPRFPNGITAWTASGQWKSADGELVRENSHVLTLIHPNEQRSDLAVLEIATAYKTQFRQEAVLRMRSTSCVSF